MRPNRGHPDTWQGNAHLGSPRYECPAIPTIFPILKPYKCATKFATIQERIVALVTVDKLKWFCCETFSTIRVQFYSRGAPSHVLIPTAPGAISFVRRSRLVMRKVVNRKRLRPVSRSQGLIVNPIPRVSFKTTILPPDPLTGLMGHHKIYSKTLYLRNRLPLSV